MTARPADRAAWIMAAILVACSIGPWSAYAIGLKSSFILPLLVVAVFWRLGAPQPVALAAVLAGWQWAILAGQWHSGYGDGLIWFGRLPLMDGMSYWSDAQRLLAGQDFSAFSSRRPIFPVLLGGLLGVAQDMRVVLVLLAGLQVAALILCYQQVRRCIGDMAAILLVGVWCLFCRRYIGTTLTEHAGISLGLLGFAGWLAGTREQRPLLAAAALGWLALALNARAGAFFVLPALWLGGIYYWQGGARRRFAIAGALMMVAAFGVNRLLLLGFGAPGEQFANFAHTLYGLVRGGDWTLIFREHPELASLPLEQQTARIGELAKAALYADPLGLLRGAVRAWTAFFASPKDGVFSMVQIPTPAAVELLAAWQQGGAGAAWRALWQWHMADVLVMLMMILGLNILAGFGIRTLWRRRFDPAQRYLLITMVAAWIGTLASVPFAPPWDANSMRAYAATLSFLILLPALAFFRETAAVPETSGLDPRRAGWLGCAVLLLLIAAAGLLRLQAQPLPRADRVCAAGSEALVLRIWAGAGVEVSEAGPTLAQTRQWLPLVSRASAPIAEQLAQAQQPMWVVAAINDRGWEEHFRAGKPLAPGDHAVCVRRDGAWWQIEP